ncbi:hypothetical protein BLNAU_4044 [Blattamonas nauphoetae]|uniref:Uncharacterized protein n=1 Tax=Blattamonas nauphoetae TaxID=2049346 RepID=A0ABQ9YB06_9EUKA|nr:hypothetical protein BLNAU_4044 [Blattamonas nauphoetae]
MKISVDPLPTSTLVSNFIDDVPTPSASHCNVSAFGGCGPSHSPTAPNLTPCIATFLTVSVCDCFLIVVSNGALTKIHSHHDFANHQSSPALPQHSGSGSPKTTDRCDGDWEGWDDAVAEFMTVLDAGSFLTHALPLPSASPLPPIPSHSPLPPSHPYPPTPLCLSLTTHALLLPSASPSPPTPSHSPLPLPSHPHPPTPLSICLSTHHSRCGACWWLFFRRGTSAHIDYLNPSGVCQCALRRVSE